MEKLTFVKITHETIQPELALEAVRHPSCGAVVSFEGRIRSENQGESVAGLAYEVYEKMFYTEVEKIYSEILKNWDIHQLALIQRVGKLNVGDMGIFIAVSSAHRREAFEACACAIEEFKKRVPVWKKEFGAASEKWI